MENVRGKRHPIRISERIKKRQKKETMAEVHFNF